MRFKFKKLSIRFKVFLATSCTLSIILFVYVFAFNYLFVAVRDEAFNEYKILTELNHQIVVMSHTPNNKEINIMMDLVNQYEKQIAREPNKANKAEQLLAKNILAYSSLFIDQQLNLHEAHAQSEQTLQALRKDQSQLKYQLVGLIHQACTIVQSKADNSIEKLFFYETISSVAIFSLLLILVTYTVNLITKPLIALRNRIDEFQGGKHSQKTAGDEIKLLINSYFSMKKEILNKQDLLEEAVIGAQNANQAKTEFLANISHELRTPMLGILGFAELGITKLEKVEKQKLLKYFERIHTSGARLLLLLNNLLDLSKLEAGEVNFEFEEAMINDIMNNVLVELDALISSKQLTIITDSHDHDIMIEMDVNRIHQVFYNIINNAIKYSPDQGIILIDIAKKSIQQQNKSIKIAQISVQDQGVGIPEDEIDYIFEKFCQSSKTDTGAGGTGLGLSICKDICDYHNATIAVTNIPKPDKGAKFTVQIPLRHETLPSSFASDQGDDEEEDNIKSIG